MDLNFFIYSFTSLFIIVDPIGLIPVFHLLTYYYSKDEQIEIIKSAIITATITLLIFAFFGTYIFDYFGITLDSFKVAGGLLLFKIAWDMLHAEMSKTKHSPREEVDIRMGGVAVVPLAIPLLAGPGAITTTIILMGKAQNLTDKTTVILSIISTMIISGLILSASDIVVKKLKVSGINAIVRIMGLILAAISVQIIFSGAYGLIKAITA
ncbi:MarC family protein [Methanotorris igneus]|uniref:UPF0056 membrane protein n=1 Tax=Methanotorris igneus (strain DSM 5666 / JCM 11834 / Kol 5) TaxID=880724 RepID=F6BCH7_METIK|nr:NAAT family transporter [Methanotorris igneus]AEF96188.1 multiple antibiotic resistance (MarC)-related protein [Methanotorris igneus Kol 5]